MDSNEINIFNFLFNEDSKNNVLNLMQVSFLGIVPLYFLNKLINFLPDANSQKGVLELIFEIILHIIILIIGIVLIVKFTLYFKPLTGVPYPDNYSMYPIITVCIFSAITYQSKLNDKLSLIKDKIINKISPKQETKTQSTPQLQSLQTQIQTHSLQNQPQTQAPTQTTQVQQLPNYNQMYQNQPIESFEPYAANEAFSGMGTNF
jgi:hypothetical protein